MEVQVDLNNPINEDTVYGPGEFILGVDIQGIRHDHLLVII